MTVLEIQRALIELGYDLGVPDGIWGPMAKEAVKAFQRNHGLSADGIAGPKTLAALKPELRDVGTHMLTIEVLRKVCPSARDDIVEGIIERRSAIDAAGIVTRQRMAHFLSQIATETRGLQALEESLHYKSAKRLMEVWPSRFKTAASAQPYVKNPQALANHVYGGRLGNDRVNDGWLYRGGGLIMTTGEANYTEAGYADRPDDLRSMPGALDSALVFWMGKGLNALADRGDIVAVRRRVNGGTIGLDECRVFFKRASKALGL
jgi:putative chitinase